MLPILKKFQRYIKNNPEKIKGDSFEVRSGYNWIVESNFKQGFPFMNQRDQEEILKLFKSKEIVRIEIKYLNCILFKIRPNYENKLTTDSWEELYIVYNDRCDCVCHTKINDNLIPEDNISRLDSNWYKVIAINKGYIGG